MQDLKKEVIDEVDFFKADKDENYLKINTMVFDGIHYLEKEVIDEVACR